MKRRPMDHEVERALRMGAAFMRHGAALVAIDPGVSTGWCVEMAGGRWSGQDEPAVAAAEVLNVLGDAPIGLLCVEKPIGGSPGRIASVSLPWAAGELRGRLAFYQVDEAALWTPLPGQWRPVLGIKTGRRRRAEVNEDVHAMAEQLLRAPLRGPGGGLEYDRANAVCLALAARRLCDMVVADQQHGSKP